MAFRYELCRLSVSFPGPTMELQMKLQELHEQLGPGDIVKLAPAKAIEATNFQVAWPQLNGYLKWYGRARAASAMDDTGCSRELDAKRGLRLFQD